MGEADERPAGKAVPIGSLGDGEWLSEAALIEATEVGEYTLNRWRSWGLIPKGARTYHGLGKGTGAFRYPPIAAEMVRRLLAIPRDKRSFDVCFWALWLDGYPVDARHWTKQRLKTLQNKASGLADPTVINKAVREISRLPADKSKTLRPVFRRLQEQEGRQSFLHWATTIGVGIEPAISLYSAKSRTAAAFRKGTGADAIPEPGLDVERMSLDRLQSIIIEASAEEIEQARNDCKTVEDLVQLAETIDWQKARSLLNLPRQGTSDGYRGPIAPFERLAALWHNFAARAAILSYLIFVRRLPDYQRELDERLASYGVELQSLAETAPAREN